MHRAGTVAYVLIQLAAENETDSLLLGAHTATKRSRAARFDRRIHASINALRVADCWPGTVLRGRGVVAMSTLLYASSLPQKSGPAVELVKALAKNFNAQVEIIYGIASASTRQDIGRHETSAADRAAAEKLREQL